MCIRDSPCGIYDPRDAIQAAQTVVRMTELLEELDYSNGPSASLGNSMARFVAAKEEHAKKVEAERVAAEQKIKEEEAEKVAKKFEISREDQDEFALHSQKKTQDAVKNNKFENVNNENAKDDFIIARL